MLLGVGMSLASDTLLDSMSQELQAQAHAHTESLARLAQQHTDTCTRLAAAAAVEADLRQQLLKEQQENRQLALQVRQVGNIMDSGRSICSNSINTRLCPALSKDGF